MLYLHHEADHVLDMLGYDIGCDPSDAAQRLEACDHFRIGNAEAACQIFAELRQRSKPLVCCKDIGERPAQENCIPRTRSL